METKSSARQPAGSTGVLRLLTWNLQVGIPTERPRHYLTRGWRHVLPARAPESDLDRIATSLRGYDLVALQEVDSGSLRTGYVDQVRVLAERGGFPWWYRQINRDLGHVAQHSNALLTQNKPLTVSRHRLPGRIPGRGALLATFGDPADPLAVLVAHLSLGRAARDEQFAFVRELLRGYRQVVVMGDLNAPVDPLDRSNPLVRAGLRPVHADLPTFPSWRPRRNLDHILVSEDIRVQWAGVLDGAVSDHLPLATEIVVSGSGSGDTRDRSPAAA